jgi:hypothetical protein
MSWVLPEEWADDFDPPNAGWEAYHGPVRDLFPGLWSGDGVGRR